MNSYITAYNMHKLTFVNIKNGETKLINWGRISIRTCFLLLIIRTALSKRMAYSPYEHTALSSRVLLMTVVMN